jgi:hypothetical protein
MTRRAGARSQQPLACPVGILADRPAPARGVSGRLLGQAVKQPRQLAGSGRACALDGHERHSGAAARKIVEMDRHISPASVASESPPARFSAANQSTYLRSISPAGAHKGHVSSDRRAHRSSTVEPVGWWSVSRSRRAPRRDASASTPASA